VKKIITISICVFLLLTGLGNTGCFALILAPNPTVTDNGDGTFTITMTPAADTALMSQSPTADNSTGGTISLNLPTSNPTGGNLTIGIFRYNLTALKNKLDEGYFIHEAKLSATAATTAATAARRLELWTTSANGDWPESVTYNVLNAANSYGFQLENKTDLTQKKFIGSEMLSCSENITGSIANGTVIDLAIPHLQFPTIVNDDNTYTFALFVNAASAINIATRDNATLYAPKLTVTVGNVSPPITPLTKTPAINAQIGADQSAYNKSVIGILNRDNRMTFLKYSLSAEEISGKEIETAKIILTPTGNPNQTTMGQAGISMPVLLTAAEKKLADNSDWTLNGITWANRPIFYNATPIGNLPLSYEDFYDKTPLEFDVTDYIDGVGDYYFAIRSATIHQAIFDSARLYIEFGEKSAKNPLQFLAAAGVYIDDALIYSPEGFNVSGGKTAALKLRIKNNSAVDGVKINPIFAVYENESREFCNLDMTELSLNAGQISEEFELAPSIHGGSESIYAKLFVFRNFVDMCPLTPLYLGQY